ncbi:tryptophan synthase subunit alpha [Fulvivirga lutimaris]|uniref:tryptophan synthase subunit alpha n=1 Tax=Fulvivirga lutimaris TaxID=1819566 RepID=UPI0012BB9B3E|nr:tryptophan synthase subunit alpha [Fulvivirga lutimaris]MTI38962.1 tryptophan synthase subunit alpha [Fulvivirga lutimaris]
MNRINKLFNEKSSGILSVYYTAGFPNIDDTLSITQHLQSAGADMVEIGIPFSDPVADGPTIQESNQKALDNGMTLKLLFEQLKGLRESVDIPVILMGYINPVIQFGLKDFCKACQEVGVDGLILPDLPVLEYQEHYQSTFQQYGLKNVFLISPQTSEDRIKHIDSISDSFIYMVSSAGTTGAKDKFSKENMTYFQRIKDMELNNPTLTGFGISNHTTFEQATQTSSGAIVGSAFIKTITNSTDLKKDVHEFVKRLTGLRGTN